MAPKNMSIIAHICNGVKEYIKFGINSIIKMIAENQFKCPICGDPLYIHSSYIRGVKETDDKITIVILRCKSRCEKGKALFPDFILPHKHYSACEIERVISESQKERVSDIDTKASESTVYRWVSQVGDRITMAISLVKATFIEMDAAVSELALDKSGGFAELESLLDLAPKRVKHSGVTLGLANLWLGIRSPPQYI